MKRHVLSRYKADLSSPGLTVLAPSPEMPMAAASYFGGKGGTGVWQTIINQMPPHETFIECFAGSATITQRKKPATSTIVIDSDAAVCRSAIARFNDGKLIQMFAFNEGQAIGWQHQVRKGLIVRCDDAVSWLDRVGRKFDKTALVYCDPPYLFDVRAGGRRKRYQTEFGEEWLHGTLLEVLVHLDCYCMINGYPHPLYDRMLSTWRRVDYSGQTRGGRTTESLWCNFDPPTELHDSRFVGSNFRERERIKRKKLRWVRRLAAMTALERSVLLEALTEVNK